MKAVVLAGGFATRLRPLSLTRPKQLFPIGSRPLLSYILENLSRHGIDRAILAVNYRANQIRAAVGNTYNGMEIEYVKEKEPLGTGGPIKQLERKLREERYFIVMNGDIFAEIDLTKMVKHHANQKNSPIATIALVKVKDPSRFGLVLTNSKGKVERFIEKPGSKPVGTSLVNAGAYVLSQKIFDYLRAGPSSIERDVFPVLAEEGLLHSFRHKDYWSDIGKPEDYLAANVWALDAMNSGRIVLSDDCTINGPVSFHPPVLVQTGCRIQQGSSIGPYAVLGSNVEVGPSCKVSRSIVFDKAVIKTRTRVSNSLVGESVLLGENLELTAMSIIADGAKISTGPQALKGVVVQPGQEIS